MSPRARKVLFPINIKLSIVVLAITGISLFSYVYLAVDMFKTDKIAYVFEAIESQNDQVALIIEKYLNQLETIHELLPEASKLSSITKKLFLSNQELLGFFEFKKGKLAKKITKEDSAQIDYEEMYKKYQQTGFYFYESTKEKILVLKRNDGDIESILAVDVSKLKSLIPQSSLYQFYLKIGDDFLDKEFTNGQAENFSKYYHQTVVIDGSQKDIVSFKPLIDEKLVFITSIHYQMAINAASQLQQRSIYFGGLVAAAIILIILFISGLFTKPIKKLYFASTELAKANFSYRVKLKERDEIGALGDSFNHMANQIEIYMGEMKEKARLENELKTAKLVQESFFPMSSIDGRSLKLNAFYKPASECGGDWWGYLKFDSTEIIILIDVTGHGTAAALLTAVIYNSLTALKFLVEKDSLFASDPAKIMHFLNQSFSAVNINLNATAFVLVVDSQKISYCNASHNPPYFVSYKENSEYSKQDFIPLMEKSGARLGEAHDSQYESVEFQFKRKDHLILYTDGILEAKNLEQKPYGTRNFVQSFSRHLRLSNEQCLEKTIDDLYTYVGEQYPDDDISLLKMEF
ncbi:MAG: SpoIIE family protein phosphatase [Halobacteriovoraceae bacterium]|nr:SpoIIE family protein phosphatase [Halobacteriovoraceae bacterium]MCB9095352.1 SpoIIE family protein phosphatase [Halobacteriovoraceae bacterium]